MPPLSGTTDRPPDARIAVYRFARYTVLFLGVVAAVKLAVVDTVVVKTDQMSPTLVQGDRIMMLRTPFIWPFSRILPPGRRAPVVARHPIFSRSYACLRIAGLPGDSMVIGKGRFNVLNRNCPPLGCAISAAESLQPEFSPRDSMDAYRLPRPGDTIDLDSLGLRDFFFAAAMIKQEQPSGSITLKADLFIDGKRANDIPMSNFALFKGSINTVPGHFVYNWFFWDRLNAYWKQAADGKQCLLRFGLYRDRERIKKHVVRGSFIFLLADDWRKGFDSRYFGPVSSRLLKGRIACVLWSIDGGKGGRGLRTDRIIKIVK
jgi:signal peptidase I